MKRHYNPDRWYNKGYMHGRHRFVLELIDDLYLLIKNAITVLRKNKPNNP